MLKQMVMVDVDDSSLSVHLQPVGWLGLRIRSQLVLFYIYQTNWVNSCNDFVVITEILS